MSTGAKLGLGSVVKRGDGGSPETFARVGECVDVPEIGEEAPLVDVTYSDSVTRDFIVGITEGMELTKQFNYLSGDAQQAALIADAKAKVTRNFQVTVPAASTKTLAYSMILLKWSLSPPKDKQQILTIKGKINSAVSIT